MSAGGGFLTVGTPNLRFNSARRDFLDCDRIKNMLYACCETMNYEVDLLNIEPMLSA